jgi:hypothetical protein
MKSKAKGQRAKWAERDARQETKAKVKMLGVEHDAG